MLNLLEVLDAPQFRDWFFVSNYTLNILEEGVEEDLTKILRGELTL